MKSAESYSNAVEGFTLIEIVVAMTIVGLGVVTLLELFSSGMRLGAGSTMRTEAITHGRQIMDEVLARRNLKDGTEQGTIDQATLWKLQVHPAKDTAEGLTLGAEWELKEVALDIVVTDAGRERHVELRTLRLFKKEKS